MQPGITPEPVGPGEESVWSYPRPPRLEPTARRIRVFWRDHLVADSTRALRFLETSHPPTYYLPPEDCDLGLLQETGETSFCEWKGVARYHDLREGEQRSSGAAWSYPEPFDRYSALKDHFAFYLPRIDAGWVDEERAVPQPGGFYGGWVTPEIKGPIKGGPGTLGW